MGGATVSGILVGVACPTTTGCVVVGYGFDPKKDNVQPLVGHSSVAGWSIAGPPTPSGAGVDRGGLLSGVDCPDSTRCFAVGQFTAGTRTRTLIEGWNGTNWAIVAQPNPTGAITSGLSGISCPTTTTCIAVGVAGSPGDSRPTRTMVARWNGSRWSVLPSPNVGDTTTVNALAAVSCVSSTRCFAVGSSTHKHKTTTLIEGWDGATWTVIPSPNAPESSYSALRSVSCASSSRCFAVGDSRTPNYQSIIEQWDGRSWSISPSPKPKASADYFRGIACPTSTTCFAVGKYPGRASYAPLIEHWNGANWSIAAGTNNASTQLESIWCRTSTNCVAVGGFESTFIERWNGHSWSIDP